MITCPECGHTISDLAQTCPECGYSSEKAYINEFKETYCIYVNGYHINLMELYIMRERDCKWAADALSKILNISFRESKKDYV